MIFHFGIAVAGEEGVVWKWSRKSGTHIYGLRMKNVDVMRDV